MTEVTEVEAEPTELDRYFERIRKAEKKFTKIVNWHTNLHVAIGEDELLPYSVDGTYNNVSQFDPKLDDNGNVVKWQQGEFNEERTLELLAKVVKHARSMGYEVDKDYSYDNFTVKVWLDREEWLAVEYFCKREAVCEAKVVGKKVVPAKPAEPPKVVDVIEWECSKLSLLGLANSLDAE